MIPLRRLTLQSASTPCAGAAPSVMFRRQSWVGTFLFSFPEKTTTKNELVYSVVVHVFFSACPLTPENTWHCRVKAPPQLEIVYSRDKLSFTSKPRPTEFQNSQKLEKKMLAHFIEKKKGHFLILLIWGNNTVGHLLLSKLHPQ